MGLNDQHKMSDPRALHDGYLCLNFIFTRICRHQCRCEALMNDTYLLPVLLELAPVPLMKSS